MRSPVPVLAVLLVLGLPTPALSQWAGLTDRSSALATDRFPFFGSAPEAGTSNENYYDGDMGDFDGDGLADRLLGSRYGLLFNTGDGFMVPIRRQVGMLLRGDPGAGGWGEDAMAMVDVDGDGDLDPIQGGNGEPLTCQWNDGGRFRIGWSMSRSALNIVNTDLEGDGDVDLAVAHAFCIDRSCGGPVMFSLLLNDGTGNFTEVSAARGLSFTSTEFIVGVVSGDIDGDGDFDLLLQRGDGTTRGVVVATNDGTGRFTRVILPLPTGGSGFGQGMNLGDIDDDGDLDLAIARGGPAYAGGHPIVSHLLATNDGRGAFTDVSATRWDATGVTGMLQGGNGKLVDIDYDGDLDFLAEHVIAGTPPNLHFQVYLNDGTGRMIYSSANSITFTLRGSALGLDVDITDLDRDGSYDVWLGVGGDVVKILMNDHEDPSGLAADVPRNARVVSEAAGAIEIAWQAPPFASPVRHYRVYRALAPQLEDRDRTLVHTVGLSRFEDQDFFAPITRHTTTAYLGDPDVTLDGARNEIHFIDRTAVPGVRYYYAVSHVGPENTESVQSAEISAMAPPPGGGDTTGPVLEIASPDASSWGRFPRIVLHYADGGSGVDESTLHVSFDRAMGSRAAGTDLSSLAYRHDGSAFVAFLAPPDQLPMDSLVTMTARIDDLAGNRTTATVAFYVQILPALVPSPMLPTSSFTATPDMGMAPLDVAFDGSASSDPDGQVIRWEWYFGDGTSGLGRQVDHRYDFGGSYVVTLLVRDTEGGIATSTRTLTVTGMSPPDGGVVGMDAGGGSDAGCTPDCTGRMCGDDGCGGTCGSCASDRVCTAGGVCQCSGALVECGTACVDTRIDESHCGMCDVPCAAGQTCSASMCGMEMGCVPDCTGRSCGDDSCGGSCGSCAAGQVCAMGGSCLGGGARDAGPGPGPDMILDGGCTCATPGPSGRNAGALALLLGLVLLPLLRRRR